MVGPGTLHPVAAVLQATPEITAADHNAYLDAQIHTLFDHVAYAADHVEIQPAACLPCQSLAADLQKHPPVLRFAHSSNPFCMVF